MYRCSYCGAEINKTDTTCSNCNAKVEAIQNNNGYSIICDEVKELNFNKAWWGNMNAMEEIPLPEGYMPIALHVVIDNNIDSELNLFGIEVRLLIEGMEMSACPVKGNNGLSDELKYGELPSYYSSFLTKTTPTINPNTSYDGWVGFFIPKDSKRFEIRLGEETYIMDNPLTK